MISQSRSSTLKQLENEQFDVVIVGGGITGAWVAKQCSALGLKTAILERGDYASETSSASSKLLHGGIRYLQQLQLGKVRESSLERAEYLFAAPHLSSAVPFLVPTYKDLKRSKFLLRCGIAAYQMLGQGQYSIMKRQRGANMQVRQLAAEELNEICDLTHLPHTGAVAFPEFHLYDTERTVWEIIDTARSAGAVAANYLSVTDILTDQKQVVGVRVQDQESGEQFVINSKLVVNAAGPWVDKLNRSLREADMPSEHTPLIHNYAAGAHVITRQLTDKHAIAITTKQKSATTIDRGGRHIFIIPWRGLSLIGTSYRETEDPNSTESLRSEDLQQLLEAVNETLPSAKLTAKDIISAYVGLYPLRTSTKLQATYQGSGEYTILDHASIDGTENLITALGAKFTTGRILAEKTVDLVQKKLNPSGNAADSPVRSKLASAAYGDLESFQQTQISKLDNRFTHEQITHLIRCYGSSIDSFIEYMDAFQSSDSLSNRIVKGQPDILGQVLWAVDREQAMHLDDVLLRRTSVGFLGISPGEIDTVANLMATRLNWSVETRQLEVEKALSRQANIHTVAKNFYGEKIR